LASSQGRREIDSRCPERRPKAARQLVLKSEAADRRSPDPNVTSPQEDAMNKRYELSPRSERSKRLGFKFDSESSILANPADPRTAKVFDQTIR
jgi:hypothetical protein